MIFVWSSVNCNHRHDRQRNEYIKTESYIRTVNFIIYNYRRLKCQYLESMTGARLLLYDGGERWADRMGIGRDLSEEEQGKVYLS